MAASRLPLAAVSKLAGPVCLLAVAYSLVEPACSSAQECSWAERALPSEPEWMLVLA
jgi:hypothetical protein